MKARAAATAAVGVGALLLLAACATTSGAGSADPGSRASSGSHSPDFPSGAVTTTVPASSSAAPTHAATPSLGKRAAQLTAQTNGQPHVIIALAGGFQAAVYDQGGDIYFWASGGSSTTWRQIGQSTYPYAAANGAPHAKVAGAELNNMDDATFIVHGIFTGDGSGNAVAFTDGSKGWGAIKAERNGNIGPSGAPVDPGNQIGLAYDFSFSGGNLVTEDCPSNRPIYQCGEYPVRKVWHWTGHDFSTA
jgi:hypothetical protein